MGRANHPRRRWWYIWLGGQRVRLAESSHSKRVARERLRELKRQADHNPPLDSDEYTIASVIEQYLEFEKHNLAESTREVRLYYPQSFAEMHGRKKVSDCKQIRLTGWLNAHPNWRSDWTVSSAISIVQRSFSWAASEGVIAANPFKGKTDRPGATRRPVTGNRGHSPPYR